MLDFPTINNVDVHDLAIQLTHIFARARKFSSQMGEWFLSQHNSVIETTKPTQSRHGTEEPAETIPPDEQQELKLRLGKREYECKCELSRGDAKGRVKKTAHVQ